MYRVFWLNSHTTAVAVYEAFADPSTALIALDGWYVLVLNDIQYTLLLGFGIYVTTRIGIQFLLWLGSILTVRRRAASIRSRAVFKTQSEAQANMELILKIAYSCDWKTPSKALMAVSSIAQVFRPNITIANQITKIMEKVVSSKDYVGQSASIEHNLRMFQYHGQADSDEKMNSKAERYWNILTSSDIGIGLSQIAVILVTTGVLPEIDWTVSNVEFFSLKAAKETVQARDIYKAFRKVIVSVVDGVANYETTGRLDGFFSNSSLESQASYYISLYQQVLVGNLYDFTRGMTTDAYLTKLESLRSKVEARMLDPRGKDRFFFRPYLDQLNNTISAIASLNLKQKYQEQAFGVMFHGPSSVGKSWSALPFIKWLLTINGYDANDENVVTYNTNSQFDDQIRNDTLGILLDDIANGKVGKGSSNQRRTSDLVISLINNVAQAAVKADVAEKGKVLMKMKVVLATTNNRSLNAEIESHCPGSVRRRFKYEVEFVVRPEWCINGSHEVDSTKVQEHFPGQQFPDVWDFRISKCQLVHPTVNQAGFIMNTIKAPSGKDVFNMYEFTSYMRDESKNHFRVQRANLHNMTREVEIDDTTQLPSEVLQYRGQSMTEDAYDFIFGEDQYEAPTEAEAAYLRDTVQLIYQDPRVTGMLRAQMS
jgi:hypothetical protein